MRFPFLNFLSSSTLGAMAIDRGNETTTQLLTLLNVSATKAGKRKWILDDTRPSEKLNKRRSVQFGEVHVNELEETPEQTPEQDAEGDTVMDDEQEAKEIAEEDETAQGAYSSSASQTPLLTLHQTTRLIPTKVISAQVLRTSLQRNVRQQRVKRGRLQGHNMGSLEVQWTMYRTPKGAQSKSASSQRCVPLNYCMSLLTERCSRSWRDCGRPSRNVSQSCQKVIQTIVKLSIGL